MYWHRYVVTEGMVVQDVYGEKQNNIYEPPPNRDMIRSEEERRPALVELGKVSCSCHEDELDECQKRSYC